MTGITYGILRGTFKLLHPGHIALISEAARNCDFLFLTIDSDSRLLELGKKVIFHEDERAAMLRALRDVSHVRIFATEKDFQYFVEHVCVQAGTGLLVNGKAHYGNVKYFKGGDYKPEDLPEKKFLDSLGIEVMCLSYHGEYSTTKLIEKVQFEKEEAK